jgi:hypothetical protein
MVNREKLIKNYSLYTRENVLVKKFVKEEFPVQDINEQKPNWSDCGM